MKNQKAFTLIELLVVIAIIGILSGIVLVSLNGSRKKAYLARAQEETQELAKALAFYAFDSGGESPPDANRDLPPGLEDYLGAGDWPDGPWPGSVYDWDNWVDPDDGSPIYQVSIRFCQIGNPGSCQFPNEPWAADFDVNSAVYLCIEGSCRSHLSEPIDHPGYCFNCGDN